MRLTLSVLPLAILAVSQDAPQVPLQPIASSPSGLSLDAIPLLGFGTWNLKESNTSEAVSYAIQVGYRHIDCAAAYGNEEAVGKGIADGLHKTGLSRDDLWITSKLWNDHHSPSHVAEAITTSLAKLNLTHLDLYHMHWPVASDSGANKISYLPTWEAMQKLVQTGQTRHIGVSNFSPAQLDHLLKHASIPPAVHQMEVHPYLQQSQFLKYHADNSIHVTAYSPLGGTNPTYTPGDSNPDPLLTNKVVAKIAKKRGCSTAQVALKWGISRGTSVIPKAIKKIHIEDNVKSTECELKKKDYKKLEKLGSERKRYNNPSKSWGVPLYEGLEDSDGKRGKAKWWK